MQEPKYKFAEIKNCLPSVENNTSYRGFISIDQEMEREIAMHWFSGTKAVLYSQRNFLFIKKP